MFMFEIWDRQTDRQTDTTVYRVAPQLEMIATRAYSIFALILFTPQIEIDLIFPK